METPETKAIYRKRCRTVELRFADTKEHRDLRRFSGRGLERVGIEAGLYVLAHNLLAVRAIRQRKAAEGPDGTPCENAAQKRDDLFTRGARSSWKTKRLIHQIKAAVEPLDTPVLAQDASSGPIIEHSWSELINQHKIIDRFSEFVSRGRIPDVMVPTVWSRFAANLFQLVRSNKPKRADIENSVDHVLACVDQRLPPDPLLIHHRLSLFQFVFGIVSCHGLLEPPSRGFCPLITEKLLAIYPDASKFGSRLLLEE